MYKFGIVFLFSLPIPIRSGNELIPEEVNTTIEALKDVTYVETATSCIFQAVDRLVTKKSFNTIIYKGIESYPQYEITQQLLPRLHNAYTVRNWTWEVTNGTRNIFKSFRLCIANCNSKTEEHKVFRYMYKQRRVVDNYLMVLDTITDCDHLLEQLKEMESYNANAGFIIYYDKIAKDAKKVAGYILGLLYNRKHFKTSVLVPTSLSSFTVYSFELFGANVEDCGKNPMYSPVLICFKGRVVTDHIESLTRWKMLNCTLYAELMIVPPLVINERKGVEIEIINTIAEQLGVNYNFSLHMQSGSWGERSEEHDSKCLNCSKWTGPLRIIDLDPFKFGLGRVTVYPERMMDFEFSTIYYIENMLWVVPIAKPIPKWASIITIFEWPTWITLASTVLLMGGLTFAIANICKEREFNFLKIFSAALLASVQILLSTAVATQPKSNSVRSLFIAYAMFMIIIGGLYQSSLINVLTNPRYEHQIDSEDEVFDSGIGVGGMSQRRDIFNNTRSERDMRIYNSYEIYDEVNDTEFQWLLTVAKDQDTITILGEYYASYFIDTKHPAIVDAHGRPLVYLIKNDALYAEQVSVVYSRGFILKKRFDYIVTILFESGMIAHWMEYYKTVKDDESFAGVNNVNLTMIDDHELDESTATVTITLEHLQGAFAFWSIGSISSLVAFVGELIYSKIRRYYVRQQFIRMVHRVHAVNRLRVIKHKEFRNVSNKYWSNNKSKF